MPTQYQLDQKERIIKELQTLPNIGPLLAQDFYNWGIRSLDDLRYANAEVVFDRLNAKALYTLDRHILWVLRSVIYWISTPHPQAKLKHWSAWKDKPNSVLPTSDSQAYPDHLA